MSMRVHCAYIGSMQLSCKQQGSAMTSKELYFCFSHCLSEDATDAAEEPVVLVQGLQNEYAFIANTEEKC